jgi:hypothetical protein
MNGEIEVINVKCLTVKLSNLGKGSHNIESLRQRLKGL